MAALPHDDVAIVFTNALRREHHFTVYANSFMLGRATGDYFGALLTFPSGGSGGKCTRDTDGHTIVPVLLDLDEDLDEEDVRLFFTLIGELNMRTFSDSAFCVASQNMARARFIATLERARQRILQMHRLSLFFGCTRGLRWVHAELPCVLDAANAEVVLAYVLSPYTDDSGRERYHVRPDAASLYSLLLMWAACLADPASLEGTHFQQLLRTLPQTVDDQDLYDMFSRRTRFTDSEHTDVELRGCVVKCYDCYDRTIWRGTTDRGSVVVHTMTPEEARGPMGSLSLTIEEARSSSGRRSVIIQRTPPTIVQPFLDEPVRPNQPPIAPANPMPPSMVHAMELRGYREENSRHNESALAIECNVSLCLVRRGTRGKAALGEMTATLPTSVMDSSTAAIPLVGTTNAPSAVWYYKIELPTHYRSDEYYHGTCQFCQQKRPVSIVSYAARLSMRAAHEDAMDECYPET